MRHHDGRRRWGAVALVALLALAGSGCGGDDDGDDASEATADPAGGTTGGDDVYGGAGDPSEDDGADDTDAGPGAVEVTDFQFEPGEIEVAVGDEVTWANDDDTAHTVTSDTAAFDLSLDGEGTTASHVFDEAGEFPYHCAIHGSMQGTVVVSEG